MKEISISVINDICTDQRVLKVADTLGSNGYRVLIIGRELPSSMPVPEGKYKVKRFRLLFNKGFLFYATYNIRLFLFLLFRKQNILLANDLDTLAANFLISKIKGCDLVYDSHEYFTEVPELQNRSFIKAVWNFIEARIFPHLKYIYTVNDSIAGLYRSKYQKQVQVLRNVPRLVPGDHGISREDIRDELGVLEGEKLLILQGSGINVDRGAEEAVLAMKYLDNVKLLIAGSGDVVDKLKQMVASNGLSGKVIFRGRMPYRALMAYTSASDLGLTLDKDKNLNYKYSLPNKLFDYIHAGIPVLCSNLPEIARIVNDYKIGTLIDEVSPECISKAVIAIFADNSSYNTYRKNTREAASELNWNVEQKALLKIFEEVGR